MHHVHYRIGQISEVFFGPFPVVVYTQTQLVLNEGERRVWKGLFQNHMEGCPSPF